MTLIKGDEEKRKYPKKDIREKSKHHDVLFVGRGKDKHFFVVVDEKGKRHDVSVSVFSDTTFFSLQGGKYGKLDSYVLAVLRYIIAYHERIGDD